MQQFIQQQFTKQYRPRGREQMNKTQSVNQ